MVKIYQKGVSARLSDDFDTSDFDCHCARPECVETYVSEELVDGLDKLAIVFPILTINSGFRCVVHNLKVGGSPNSQHTVGKAVDVQSPFGAGRDLKVAAEVIPVFKNGGIGVAKNWIHLDVRGKPARWSYPIVKT